MSIQQHSRDTMIDTAIVNFIEENGITVTDKTLMLAIYEEGFDVHVLCAEGGAENIYKEYHNIVTDDSDETISELIDECVNAFKKALTTNDPQRVMGLAALLAKYAAIHSNADIPTVVCVSYDNEESHLTYRALDDVKRILFDLNTERLTKRKSAMDAYMATYAANASKCPIIGYDNRNDTVVVMCDDLLTAADLPPVKSLLDVLVTTGFLQIPNTYRDFARYVFSEPGSETLLALRELHLDMYARNEDMSPLAIVLLLGGAMPQITAAMAAEDPIVCLVDILPTNIEANVFCRDPIV